jgi:hypothetical protein
MGHVYYTPPSQVSDIVVEERTKNKSESEREREKERERERERERENEYKETVFSRHSRAFSLKPDRMPVCSREVGMESHF